MEGEMLSIQSSVEIKLLLFDQRGIEVMSNTITEDNSTLDLGFLPSACYYYNAISKGRLISAGKLVKID
jgi:hypothetical protein